MNHAIVARALGLVDRTAWIITSSLGDDVGGLVATFVNSASLVPELPRLLVGIAHHHHTWTLIQRSRTFAAHLVNEAHCDLFWQFGLGSGRDVDKFAGVRWHRGTTGAPVLDDGLASLECTVEGAFDIGDRTLFLGAIVDGHVSRAGTPVTSERLIALAGEERRVRLDAERRRDEVTDGAAILEWRGKHDGRSP